MLRYYSLFILILVVRFNALSQYCENNLYSNGCSFNGIIYDFSIDMYSQSTFCSLDGYGNYTTDTISLEKGISYNYTLTSLAQSADSNHLGIWIDFNDDSDFDDTLEFLGGSGPGGFSNLLNGALFIDSTLPLGPHRMRLRVVNGTNLYDTNACTTFNEGETQDYIVHVLAVPTCPRPSSLIIDQVSSHDVILSYATTASVINVEYGSKGFLKGTGTTVNGVGTNPYQITGLNPNTEYDVYIQADCGGSNGQSLWYGPVSFKTRLAPYIAPWVEPFDTAVGSMLPYGWLTYSSTSKEWHTTTSVPLGPSADHTSGNGQYAFVYDLQNPDPNTPDVTMETPLVDISGLNNPVLEFYYWSAPGPGVYRLTVDLWDGTQWLPRVLYDTAGTSGVWKQMIIDAGQTTGDTVKARFIVDEDNGSPFPANHVSIDDVGFVESPPCPAPHSISVGEISRSSAYVSWSGFTGDDYELEYGLTGFIPGSGTSVSLTQLNDTLRSLNSSTTYDVYVVKNCSSSSNGYSDTLGPISFTTACDVVNSYPFSENFDGSSWQGVSNWTISGDIINHCWERSPENSGSTGYYAWTLRTGTSLLPESGPSSDFSGSGNYFSTLGSYGGPGDVAYLYLPELDLSGLDTPMVSFYYHMYGSDMGSLSLEVSSDSGSTWTTITTFNGPQHALKANYWTEELASIYNHKSAYTLVRFKAVHGPSFKSDVAIDNVTVREKASCENPYNLGLISKTDTSATITFDGGGNNIMATWGPPGFAQGTLSANFTNDTITVGGLMPNVCYEIVTYNDCSGNLSQQSLPIYFCTECATVNTFPWTEDFEANGINCWKVVNGIQDFNEWELDTNTFNSRSPISSASLFMNFSDADWLISPKIHLDGNQRMKYWVKKQLLTEKPQFTVLISTTGNEPADFTDTLVATTVLKKTTYDRKQVFLDNYSGDVYLAFYGGNNSYGHINLDDILIEDIPACIDPDNFVVSAVDTSRAYFSWENFGGNDFIIEYGPTGFTPGSGTAVPATGNQDTVTGLSPNTTYEAYIRQDCGTGYSIWVGPVSFTTLCPAYSMPYLESFDNWPLSCWDTTRGRGVNFWHEYVPASGGTDHYALAYLQTSAFDSAILVSPPVIIDTAAQLEFYWSHKWSGLYAEDSLLVRVQKIGTGVWDTLMVLEGYYDYNDNKATGGGFGSPGTPGDFVKEKIILDSSYIGSAVMVEFWASTKYNSPYSTFLNDVSIRPLPDCLDPDSLNVSNISTTGATISWTSKGSSSDIWFGPEGFDQASQSTNIIYNVGSPYNLGGLAPGTPYDVYVRDSCATGSTSDWVGPFTFITPCYSRALSTPYFDDFEDPKGEYCYKILDVNRDGNKWHNLPTSLARSGTQAMAILTNYTNGDNNDWLITPKLHLGPQDSLSFFYLTEVAGWFVEPDTMVVRISTSGNDPADFSTVLWSTKITNTTYNKVALDLSGYANDSVYIAIQIPAGYDGVRNLVDNLFIGENSGCTLADSLNADVANCDSATFSWHSASAIQSIVEYDTAGFTPGTGILRHNVSSPLGISGLDAGKAYDFYVAELCVNGDTSAFAGPYSFTMDSIPLPVADFTNDTAGNAYTINFDGSTSTGNPTTYFWDFGDGHLDTGKVVTHTFSTGGDFNITLTVKNSCGEHDTTITVKGIDLPEMEWVRSFALFPNPAGDQISVQAQLYNASDIVLQIHDITGKNVLSIHYRNDIVVDETIDIGRLSQGVYQLSLQSDFGVVRKKLIVK